MPGGLGRIQGEGDAPAGNTIGLNMVLRGWLKPGDHCLVSAMEHNAVMRPLQDLAAQGVSFDRVPCDSAATAGGLGNEVAALSR